MYIYIYIKGAADVLNVSSKLIPYYGMVLGQITWTSALTVRVVRQLATLAIALAHLCVERY